MLLSLPNHGLKLTSGGQKEDKWGVYDLTWTHLGELNAWKWGVYDLLFDLLK